MSPLPRSRSGDAVLTLGLVQQRLAAAFGAVGLETPALDARLLVAGALGIDRAAPVLLAAREMTSDEAALVDSFARRRLAREPVSRILGRRAFFGLDLEIGPATLDPRPETETLVENVIALVRGGETPGGAAPRILDLGTGSGAILIALLTALPEATGVGADISLEALAIAGRNAHRHGVIRRLQLAQSRWLDAIGGPFDLVVSNPPYIERAAIATLEPEVAQHDPWLALDGGLDGLDPYRDIIGSVDGVLARGGWLALEIGLGQETALQRMLAARGLFELDTGFRRWADLTGRWRCVAAKARH